MARNWNGLIAMSYRGIRIYRQGNLGLTCGNTVNQGILAYLNNLILSPRAGALTNTAGAAWCPWHTASPSTAHKGIHYLLTLMFYVEEI